MHVVTGAHSWSFGLTPHAFSEAWLKEKPMCEASSSPYMRYMTSRKMFHDAALRAAGRYLSLIAFQSTLRREGSQKLSRTVAHAVRKASWR